MIPFNMQKLRQRIQAFQGRRVIVLGDLMLDRYIWGRVSRISPEAPVPVVEVANSTSTLGGAGNVAANIRSLGGIPVLVGIVGDDSEGEWIRKSVAESDGIFIDPRVPTTVKTRIIAHHQQVVRVDQEKKRSLPQDIEEKIMDFVRRQPHQGLIISDYSKGLLSRSLMKRLLPLSRRRKIPVFVDPKVENFRFFSPITFITPNHIETERIVNHPCRTEEDVEAAGRHLLSLIKSRYLIIKRGEQGMSIFEQGKKPLHIPTIARDVFDVTGAGDTVLAVAALALLAGSTIREAAVLANAAAGIVVGKVGTATVTPAELVAVLRRAGGRTK
ncbi:MAG: D-glycero-beta-D-manno-heptose-7-phosphate kinase [Candidatus Aminicenantes bacterium]|nr:D-glycero-beta-D-manno-heptose-7-phosphate kinase [Candidatus Aminicenantes bacterium]